MLTCLNHPFAVLKFSEYLQRQLSILIFFNTCMCLWYPCAFPWCVCSWVLWCLCTCVQVALEAWSWHLVSSLVILHWTWSLLIPTSLASQFVLGDYSLPILSPGIPGRRHRAQLQIQGTAVSMYVGTRNPSADLHAWVAGRHLLSTELSLWPTPVSIDF